MNALVIGTHKAAILQHATERFLFIDDGPLIDALKLPERLKVVRFDVGKHRLNPLQGMDYKRAREFIAVLGAVFPEGESTLTKKNADFVLLEALLDKPTYLDKLLRPDKKDAARQDAYQKIETLLMSPVLRKVLCQPTNFSMKGVVLARLDRAVLGDFDCFLLANLLISQFEGTVIIPDGGFYLRPHHVSLIRQNRLVVGINTLSEVSEELRQTLLTIPKKIPSQTTYKDAAELASYLEKNPPHTDGYDTFIKGAMS